MKTESPERKSYEDGGIDQNNASISQEIPGATRG